jgi:putative DNA methylase
VTLSLQKVMFEQASEEDRAIEHGFPIVPVSKLAERESWRKELGRPLYHIHKWWATRLGSVFRAIVLGALSDADTDIWGEFYQKHDFHDRVVLDPFMGSGTTLGEALKLGCSVVGCDINPVSTFLVRQALTPVSEEALRKAFEKLEASVSGEIKRYYTTNDRETGRPIPVLYAFWVKEVVTPQGERIPLFSSYIFSRDAYPKKRPRAQLLCPSCWHVFEGRYDNESSTCPQCAHTYNPQKGPAAGQTVTGKGGDQHRIKGLLPSDGSPPSERLYALMALRETGEKVYLAPTEGDFALYREATVRLATEDLPLPTTEVRPGHNTNQARGYGFTKWADFFNDRQKLCLGLLLRDIQLIEDIAIREQMLCLFSSTLEFNNRFCSFKGEGTGAVRHMFSHHILKPERTPLESSVWGGSRCSGTFATLFESRLLPAKRYLGAPFELGTQNELFKEQSNGKAPKVIASSPIAPVICDTWKERRSSPSAVILNGDSAHIPIPDKSVDAVITDPPYFDFIHYSELSDFFYAWLSPVLKDQYSYFEKGDSSDPGEVQQKDPQAFSSQLSSVLRECHRVLKDSGVMSFSFHHSQPDGWAAIYSAVSSSGFDIVAAHPVHAELKASSPKAGTRSPISLDAILVCRKRDAGRNHVRKETINSALKSLKELSLGGATLSIGDEFVVYASEALVNASARSVDSSELLADLTFIKNRISAEEGKIA